MIPFMEKIVGDFLRGRSDITTVVGDRVATKMPSTLDKPWVRITLIDDPPVKGSTADHLIDFYLQLDCYAGKDGDQTLASTLARTVRSAIGEIDKADHEGAVVTGAKVNGSRPMSDPDFEGMDRYMVTVTIWAHA